jgi:hypothetical protein
LQNLRKCAQPTGLSFSDSGEFCRAFAKSCDGSVSERRRGCVPYFSCREFLEKNSSKSGWSAAHKQGGKVGYAVMSSGGFMGICEEFSPSR